MRRAIAREQGTTLVEVLAAVALIGIAFLTILGGMMTAAVGADVHRKAATADLQVRSYAEAIRRASYVDCATTSSYTPAAVGYAAPAGFSASVTDVDYWRASHADPDTGSWSNACPTDQGAQRVTVSLSADDGRAATSREVVKGRP